MCLIWGRSRSHVATCALFQWWRHLGSLERRNLQSSFVLFISDTYVFKLSSSLLSPASNSTWFGSSLSVLLWASHLIPTKTQFLHVNHGENSPFSGKSSVRFLAGKVSWWMLSMIVGKLCDGLRCQDDAGSHQKLCKSSLLQSKPAAVLFLLFSQLPSFFMPPICPGLHTPALNFLSLPSAPPTPSPVESIKHELFLCAD